MRVCATYAVRYGDDGGGGGSWLADWQRIVNGDGIKRAVNTLIKHVIHPVGLHRTTTI